MQGKGLVNPRLGGAWCGQQMLARNLQGGLPVAAPGQYSPTQCQHFRVPAFPAVQPGQFLLGFGHRPEFQPAGGGVEAVAVGVIQ
jgi:hypothetical protein